MDEIVFLKKFGILNVNKKVKGHKIDKNLWRVYVFGNWHTVPSADVEPIK